MDRMATAARFEGCLFDMDGTLLTSIASVERIWSAWARRHGLEVESFLARIHGIQAVEVVRREDLPGLDPEEEAAALTRAELEDMAGTEAIAGAAAFLASLPPDRWAIVTSAQRRLAIARLRAVGLPVPAVLVCAEDVARSKPAPDGFLMAARQLGVDPAQCLVFEDSPAGVAAGEAAGASVIVLGATHSRPWPGGHRVIRDYRELRVERRGEAIALLG
jgi:mannitol-1-/sugar-/sorbitol-6-phosphatase